MAQKVALCNIFPPTARFLAQIWLHKVVGDILESVQSYFSPPLLSTRAPFYRDSLRESYYVFLNRWTFLSSEFRFRFLKSTIENGIFFVFKNFVPKRRPPVCAKRRFLNNSAIFAPKNFRLVQNPRLFWPLYPFQSKIFRKIQTAEKSARHAKFLIRRSRLIFANFYIGHNTKDFAKKSSNWKIQKKFGVTG